MGRMTRTIVVSLLVLVIAVGCSRSPEAQKARHLGRGDKHFDRAQYREAVLEYMSVLKLDGTNPQAIRQLGRAHYQLGELDRAYAYLVKATEREPNDVDVRLKLGNIFLLGGRPVEARQHATVVIEKDPKNFDGLILWTSTARTPEEADAAIQRLEQVQASFGDRAKFHMALGALYLRKQDVAGAERALREAVAKEPKSVDAHTSLGDFYIAKRDTAQAEAEYKAAAALAPVASAARLKLADFYLSFQKPDEGKRLLAEMTEKAPDFLPAWRRLAEVALVERRYDDAFKPLDAVFKKNPSDLDALVLRGRARLAKGETTLAIQDLQKAVRLEPRLAPAHYHLALAYLQSGNLLQARSEVNEAATNNPGFTDAVLLQAELQLQARNPQSAIEALEKLIAARPNEVRAYILLGTAYMANRSPARATEVYRKIVALAPKDPRGPYLVGISLRGQRKRVEAAKEFEAAMALAPDFAEPLGNLVSMLFEDKQRDAALDRVKKQLALAPNAAALYELLGLVHEARNEPAAFETSYLRAIALDPRRSAPYVQLARLYAISGRYNQALARLDETLKADPKQLRALMLSAAIHVQKGDVKKAEEVYEKILAQEPRLAHAANNLAYLYSEHGGDQERALQLAQIAKETAPDDPDFSDTLGWILYKRGVYQRAFALLQASASKLPDNAVVQYHLGMAAYKTGDKELARRALSSAVALPAKFPGKDEASKILSQLR